MSAKAVLIAARELIAPEGAWQQRKYFDFEEVEGGASRPCAPFCAVGALDTAARKWDLDADMRSARSRLKAVIGTEIVIWNDTIGRTQDQVLEAFDKAIAACGAMS